MLKLWNWLNGNKTTIAVVLSVVLSVLGRRGVEVPPWVFDITDGILGLGLAHKAVKVAGPKIASVAAAAFALCVLTGCAGLTPSGLSPSTAGAPATATQGAQTIGGSQGQAPSTATGGTAAISWHFASSVKPETVNAILDLAREGKWTAEQVESAMRAAAGAPHTVNITTTGNTASGGNASSIPAAGGTAEPNAATGSGNATRP
jgi:hypothetical protein